MRQTIETIIKNIKQDGIAVSTDFNAMWTRCRSQTDRNRAMHIQDTNGKNEAIFFNPLKTSIEYDNALFQRMLFHELGHATGHRSRLNRPVVGDNEEITLADEWDRMVKVEELIAERTAQKCLAHFNINDPEQKHMSEKYLYYHLALVEDLTDLEAHNIEIKASLAFQYILIKWVKVRQDEVAA